jgi:hypothetical protein
MPELLKTFRLAKVDESTRTVYGISTAEVPDHEREICDFASAKAAYASWSDGFAKATAAAGQDLSLGNIRLMHTGTVAGKATGLDFDDANKAIYLKSTPKDDATWELLKGGFLTGYSQGGDYAWRKCSVCETDIAKSKGNHCPTCRKVVDVRYGPVVGEVSYVDSPCLPTATFQYVKMDGTAELRKFGRTENVLDLDAVAERVLAKMKKSEEVLAAPKVDETKDVDEGIVAKAEEIQASLSKRIIREMEKSLAEGKLQKGLYDVSNFASLLSSLYYLARASECEADWEQDDSPLPAQLKALLDEAIKAFLAMAQEETTELTASAAKKGSNMDPKIKKSLAEANAAHHASLAEGHKKLAEQYKAADDQKASDEHTAKAAEAGELAKKFSDEAAAVVIPVDAPAEQVVKATPAAATSDLNIAEMVKAQATASIRSAVEEFRKSDEWKSLVDSEVKKEVATYLKSMTEPTMAKAAGFHAVAPAGITLASPSEVTSETGL